MFTAPTAFRAIKQQDPGGIDQETTTCPTSRPCFLAGERSDPDTLKWAETNLGVPVIDHWWQTETGWAICANCMGMHSSRSKRALPPSRRPAGTCRSWIRKPKPVKAGDIGALVVKLPLPPGTLPTLWQNDERYVESYLDEFPGYYKTADAGFIDEDGYAYIMARTDDIINVAGHRLSTGAWRRCWPIIPMWPSAPSWASTTS
jgi:propionyl-CoA synthetase